MISVMMLTYNREDMVSKAIESILNQTYTNFEFIICDNGSIDNSGKIADEYARKDRRIKVIHRERGNIGAGRNTLLDSASGKYQTFIDDDDWAEPDYLEFLLNLIIENDSDVSICGAADKIYDEKKNMNAEEALIELMWRKKYNVAFPTKMFKKSVIDELRFPEEGSFDDISLMYKLLANAKKIAYHGLSKYTFYRHENNNSAWTTHHELITPEILDEYLQSYRIRTKWLSEKFPNSAHVFRYFEWSFMISMIEKINRFDLDDCYSIMNMMKKELTEKSDEFLNSEYCLEIEKEWMDKYVFAK